jgi:hypothetical protein
MYQFTAINKSNIIQNNTKSKQMEMAVVVCSSTHGKEC